MADMNLLWFVSIITINTNISPNKSNANIVNTYTTATKNSFVIQVWISNGHLSILQIYSKSLLQMASWPSTLLTTKQVSKANIM